jgi:chorismate mutase
MSGEFEARRKRVAAIDLGIVELLRQRFEETREIGTEKTELGLPARDPAKEAEKLELLCRAAAEEGLDPAFVADLFRGIFNKVVAEHELIAWARAGADGTQPILEG